MSYCSDTNESVTSDNLKIKDKRKFDIGDKSQISVRVVIDVVKSLHGCDRELIFNVISQLRSIQIPITSIWKVYLHKTFGNIPLLNYQVNSNLNHILTSVNNNSCNHSIIVKFINMESRVNTYDLYLHVKKMNLKFPDVFLTLVLNEFEITNLGRFLCVCFI